MRASIAAGVVGCALLVAVGAASAAGGPAPRAGDGPTTTGPKPTDPPRAQPTTTLAPTTAPDATTTVAPAPTLAPAPTAAPTTAEPPDTFDPAGYFRDVYFTLSIEPADLLQGGDIEQTVLGSPAELFVFYLFSFGVVHRDNTTAPLPLFTVTEDGDELNVCPEDARNAEDRDCQVFGKFATRGGELRSFSIDGQPIDDRLGGYFRTTTVEALSIDAAIVFKRPTDEVLSIILLFFSEDGATEFTWEEAFFIDENGRQFSPDLDNSLFTERVESETFGSAMLEFPAARPDGQLVIPITTEQTGEPTVIRIPIRLSEL